MFLRDAATGRKIFVYPTFPGFDPAFTADIQSNGGRNDIVTVRNSCCTDCRCIRDALSTYRGTLMSNMAVTLMEQSRT